MQLDEIFSESVGIWYERKAHFDEFASGATYALSVRQGTLELAWQGGRTRSLTIQLLATVAEGEWLWAWANPDPTVPEQVLEAAKRIRAFGEGHALASLTRPSLTLDDYWVDDRFAAISYGIVGGGATFRWDHGSGAVWVLVEDADFVVPSQPILERVRDTFLAVDEAYELGNPQGALSTYLRRSGLEVSESKDSVVGRLPDGRTLSATFDADGRLAEIRVRLR